MPLQSSASSLP